MKSCEMIEAIRKGSFCEIMTKLYGEENLNIQYERYIKAIESFCEVYGDNREIELFSVPGRSEISGNHTDHNHGCVLAASIDLDIIAVASKTEEAMICIKSEGFPEDRVDILNLEPDASQYYTSSALIAGVCKGFENRGYGTGGYVAYTTSNVFKGSGLSSSAAFEDMVGNILNYFYNDSSIENAEIAKISQYSENVFFGKPCGLMDQTACAVGGFVSIDFLDPEKPMIRKVEFDLNEAGYSLCIVNTGGNHADLNEDYASVPQEMKQVASLFGKDVLREVTMEEIFSKIAQIRETYGDRALLRATHFIMENERVQNQTAALAKGDLNAFFEGVMGSGDSSFKYLQNIYTTKNITEQGLSVALRFTEYFLDRKKAAWRVHGGGFAGTIQAFVPTEAVNEYKEKIEQIFGKNACYVLKVRPLGAICVSK